MTGFLLAAVLPGTFIFSGGHDHALLFRFLISFLSIFSLWILTFTSIDFSRLWLLPGTATRLKIMLIILRTTVLAVVLYLVIGLLDESGMLLAQVKGGRLYDGKAWFYMVLRIALLNGLIILIKYFYDFSAEKARIQSEMELVKRENLTAMHETLKQQLNPHFLFNSLNTLRSLVKTDVKQSLLFIDELSAIYRYMLVHSEKNDVTLREEIEFVTSYLSLLQIRYGDSVKFELDVPAEKLTTRMPPNTLQVLIENVVKHNVLSRNRPLSIRIYATQVHVVVQNNLQPKGAEGFSSNVGLNNINNRYMILTGKPIVIDKNKTSFTVKLPLY
jgi:two-component system, LytTR family, sensor kinase